MAYEIRSAQPAESHRAASEQSPRGADRLLSSTITGLGRPVMEIDVRRVSRTDAPEAAATPDSQNAQDERAVTSNTLRLTEAFRAQRQRVSMMSEGEMVIADLVADSGPGSIRRAITAHPEPA